MARRGKWSTTLHGRHKILAAPLSSDLRKSHGCRSLPVRKGDKVKLVRGDFKGMEGEVTGVDSKNRRITIEGVVTTKADESEVPHQVHPSNVVITKLHTDRMRDRVLGRRSKGGEKGPEKTP